MTDIPASNGSKRFEDLVKHVDRMDDKLDRHGEALAEIKALLSGRPCSEHEGRLRIVEQQATMLMGGAQVSVAKVTGLSAIVSGVITAIGHWFMAKGS